jgi:hypothetical protein
MIKQFRRLLPMFLFISLSAMIFGQGSTTSSMSGKIIESNGQPLAGSIIFAVHEPSGTTYGASANAQGMFTIQGMRPGGPYRSRFLLSGIQRKPLPTLTSS